MTDRQAAQQGAAPDRLQPALVPRFGFRRRVSLVVLLLARGVLALGGVTSHNFVLNE